MLFETHFFRTIIFFAFLSYTSLGSSEEAKIKDLVNIKGVRANELIGYGLVVGLSGTGDSKASLPTRKAAALFLNKMGISTSIDDFPTNNLASVIVTSQLPPFSRIGDKLDVKVSAQGGAKSLAGGTLLFTALKGADGQIYAVAQGSLVLGQVNGSGVQVFTVARVPQGAYVEKEFIGDFVADDQITLSLKHSDFTTNTRIVQMINQTFKGFYAKSYDPTSISVDIPENYLDTPVEFISKLEQLKVISDMKAVIVLNERTGTVVMGQNVSINPVTISHGDLSIKIGEKNSKDKQKQSLLAIDGATVGKLVEALNALGVKPADLVGIIQALHSAGALNGELQFL